MSYSRKTVVQSSNRRVVATALGLALFAGVSLRPSALHAARAASADPVFRALLLDGRTLSGRIVELGRTAVTLVSAEGARHELAFDRLVKLTRDSTLSLAPLDRSHLILPDGDCLTRVVVGFSTETALEIQSDALGKLEVPLDSLVGLILKPPADGDELDALWDRVRFEPRSSEVVWLINGDRISGGFLGLDDKAIKIQVNSKPVDVDRTGALALGFATGAVSYPRPTESFLQLTLKDGTRLGVGHARLNDGNVEAKTRFGQSIRFSLSELVGVHARSSSITYLSEREPYRTRYYSYVGPTREIRGPDCRWPSVPACRPNLRSRHRCSESQLRRLLPRPGRSAVPGLGRCRRTGRAAGQRRISSSGRWPGTLQNAPLDRSRPAQIDRSGCLGRQVLDPRHRFRRSGRRP